MKAIVTGIKSYLTRLSAEWADHNGRRYDEFSSIRTKKEVMDASYFNGNTGNFFIGEGAIQAVGREKAHFVDFGFLHSKMRLQEYSEYINKEFDCIVFVTANLLRSDYDAKAEADLLARFDIPIVVLGIGCQRIGDLAVSLPAGTRRLIEVLIQSKANIFPRGQPTADFLKSMGLENVWPTGCPSMFLRPENVIESFQKLKEIDWNEKLKFMFSGYLGQNSDSVRDIQNFSNRAKNSSYVLQDEHLFHGFDLREDFDDAPIYNDMSGKLAPSYSFKDSSDIPDVDMRIFFNTHQWRAVMSAHDVSLGKRFHGVVSGMQVSTPGLMIAVDDRMREMLKQFELPYVDILEWSAADQKLALLTNTVKKFNLDAFSTNFLNGHRRFVGKMAEIGLG